MSEHCNSIAVTMEAKDSDFESVPSDDDDGRSLSNSSCGNCVNCNCVRSDDFAVSHGSSGVVASDSDGASVLFEEDSASDGHGEACSRDEDDSRSMSSAEMDALLAGEQPGKRLCTRLEHGDLARVVEFLIDKSELSHDKDPVSGQIDKSLAVHTAVRIAMAADASLWDVLVHLRDEVLLRHDHPYSDGIVVALQSICRARNVSFADAVPREDVVHLLMHSRATSRLVDADDAVQLLDASHATLTDIRFLLRTFLGADYVCSDVLGRRLLTSEQAVRGKIFELGRSHLL